MEASHLMLQWEKTGQKETNVGVSHVLACFYSFYSHFSHYFIRISHHACRRRTKMSVSATAEAIHGEVRAGIDNTVKDEVMQRW